jgi:hypothetical protein
MAKARPNERGYNIFFLWAHREAIVPRPVSNFRWQLFRAGRQESL